MVLEWRQGATDYIDEPSPMNRIATSCLYVIVITTVCIWEVEGLVDRRHKEKRIELAKNWQRFEFQLGDAVPLFL